MSKRKDILTAIKSQLESLVTLPNTVHYWHDLDLEYAQDCIEFRDLQESMSQSNLIFDNELFIRVRVVKFTEDFFEEGENALLALIKGLVNQHWDNKSVKTLLLNNKKTVKTAGKKAVICEINFKVCYRELYE